MMPRLSLRRRLLLLTLLPSALIAVALVVFFTLAGVRTLENELHGRGLATVRHLAPLSEYSILSGQLETLHSLVQTAVQESGVKAAIIVNPRGKTVAVSGRVSLAAEDLRQTLERPGVVEDTTQWIAFGAPVVRALSDVDALFDPAAASRPAANEVIGTIFVEFDKTQLLEQQMELWQRGLGIVLFGLLALAALAVAMADTLARPVMHLVEAVRRMSAGQLDTRVRATTSGELGELERGFNEMAANLEETHRSLQERVAAANAQLAFQTRHDPLTGLPNRIAFTETLQQALAAAQSGAADCCLLFIDLDRFKAVNDDCGHLAGDELLRQLGQLFQGRLREEDVLARLGGDEFGILLSNCSAPRARQVAEDLCSLAGAFRFIWQDKIFTVDVSIGLSPLSRQGVGAIDMLAAADTACRRARELGPNQVAEQAALPPGERRQENSAWTERIARALEHGQLQIEAIPLSPLQGRPLAEHVVELGARLAEPGLPPLALGAVIDAVDRPELTLTVDQRLLDIALTALATARRSGQALHCLVPVSRASLAHEGLASHLRRGLDALGIDGHGLHLVFPEDVASSRAMEFARQVRAVGAQVGLADFGGDLSSFNHLHSLAPSCVVLSRRLTRGLAANRGAGALLRAIHEITADQRILTIGDGIDDAQALDQLRALGIDYAGGRAVAPCEPFEAWLEGAVLRNHD